MKTDSKTLIHKSRHGDRLVEIFDRENFRYLYFNTKFLQSKMALDAPHLLVLPYTRYMMLSLMFIPDPKRILLIGARCRFTGAISQHDASRLPNRRSGSFPGNNRPGSWLFQTTGDGQRHRALSRRCYVPGEPGRQGTL